MSEATRRGFSSAWMMCTVAGVGLATLLAAGTESTKPPIADVDGEYEATVSKFLKKYCLDCHSTQLKKGDLDLQRFATFEQVRQDLEPWQHLIEQLEAGEMPPKDLPQPSAEERARTIAWVRNMLDAEARARSGDPGRVPLRRLSNAEYDCTIRDLTGVDLRPTREFPADGAAGEGFTNAAEALSDISPALLEKYLDAAREIADHAVLLPDGFRFSPAKTRRDWTDESLARLRRFHSEYAPDGRLPLVPYLAATVRHRDALAAGTIGLQEAAAREKVNAKYLEILWRTLTDPAPSHPLDGIRARWRQASEKDVAALAAEIATWQGALWQFATVGSYLRQVDGEVYESTIRQIPKDPAAAEVQPLKYVVAPAPGEHEIVLYLATRDIFPIAEGGHSIWRRPRFERAGKPPLLLRDYSEFGEAFEVDYSAVFADSAKYLGAVAEAAVDRKQSVEDLAKKHALDVELLKRWIAVVAIEPPKEDDQEKPAKAVAAAPLDLLDEQAPRVDRLPAIGGWRRKGIDLPALLSNASDAIQRIPGDLSPHQVAVHPTPGEFAGAVWKSPLSGSVRIAARVSHAHPTCGNGVAWRLEHRRADRGTIIAEGVLELGEEVTPRRKALQVEKGDLLLLAVDARDGNHSCDLTEIALNIAEAETPGGTPARAWDLAPDVADSIGDGNPHADRHGNKDAWSFVKGPAWSAASTKGATQSVIPPGSALGRWRVAAVDPERRANAVRLAAQVQALLTGARPTADNPDRVLFDRFAAADGALLKGLALARLAKPRPAGARYGLEKSRFGGPPAGGPIDDASLVVAANTVTEVRLPAALFRDHAFVVEGALGGIAGDRIVQFRISTAPPPADAPWDGKGPVVASPTGDRYRRLLRGHDEFRRCFPSYICFADIMPSDGNSVYLKMYHREDEPLIRLFLDGERKRILDKLWEEHIFISQQPLTEYKYLPQYIGFATQDAPKKVLAFIEGLSDPFRRRAAEFEKSMEVAIPLQHVALLDFASRAWRRPLRDEEKAELLGMYRGLREKDVAHDEAFRRVLVRVLVSPAFLFRIERAPPGKEPAPVDDWELATRLSYFLWSSAPDGELRQIAASGRLRDPHVLAAQVGRMLQDERLRALAIEFGTQSIHVRGFDESKEKNERLFPTFDAELRAAIYEESILFFQDLFRSDRPVTDILDAEGTFLNETLAKHYGIPGVTGPQWRRVEGVRKHGRGGVLGLASVQSRQAGASRTSPVLRGNWVVETLLGEKLPRPPADVPRLPESEGEGGLTMRQQVEKHAGVQACAVCHVRIDPFGFALESYDPIGRLREKDLAGLPIDAGAKLKDGTEFEGIDGLRTYLLTRKKEVIVRLFCRRLLGYALGRAVTLSDTKLLDEMVAELDQHDGRISSAVQTIVRSPQFRMIRGSERSE